MSRTYKRRHKKTNNIKKSSIVKKSPPVSYKIMKDLTKSKEPVSKYDSHGNLIYYATFINDEKFEYWLEYNIIGQAIHYRDSRNNEWWVKYNSKNNISDYWDSTGYSESYNYYCNNIVIRTDSFGNKVKKIINRDKVNVTREVFITTESINA